MEEITITIKVQISGKATAADALEYISFEVGYGSGLTINNPFIEEGNNAELEIIDVEIE